MSLTHNNNDQFKMKSTLIIITFFLLINHGFSNTMHVVTEDPYQWFPLRTNYLHFNVKANAFAYIRLSAHPNIDQPFYKFVIGDSDNTVTNIRRDNESVLVSRKGKFLSGSRYDSFAILVNEKTSTVSVLNGLNETIVEFHDPNFIKMSYFGFGTRKNLVGDWMFDFDSVFPAKCD